jgi:hypothetical protein
VLLTTYSRACGTLVPLYLNCRPTVAPERVPSASRLNPATPTRQDTLLKMYSGP